MSQLTTESVAGNESSTAHGVSAAWYSNRGDGTQWAIIECLCGETITGQSDSWESTGSEMDAHISNELNKRKVN